MEDLDAQLVVDYWSGGSGVVARGPKTLLSVVPATPGEIERHTGRRPSGLDEWWKLEVGGRFVSSRGVVYPSGVPFPEELHSQTAVISGEVWLYTNSDGDVVGSYWWPDAVRRPVASIPRDDYSPDEVMDPNYLDPALRIAVPIPAGPEIVPVVVASTSPEHVVVFCTDGSVPEPLNEMCTYEQGGLTISARLAPRPDLLSFLAANQPPYRKLSVGSATAVGRDPGRSLGPQTWPWPGEVRWWDDGAIYELKGFRQVSELASIASNLEFRSPSS